MATGIIIVLLAVVLAQAVRASAKHFRGEGGCCGGGTSVKKEKAKKLSGPVIMKKEMTIQGMHCENCRRSVENAVNRISGVSCRVDLKKNLACISYTEDVEDEILKQEIESQGFRVTEVRKG